VICAPELIGERLAKAERLWLFVDYDGTVAEFAPTPDYIAPVQDVVDLMTRLAQHPRLCVAVVSGRRLEHVRSLLPVPGILLGGTYGIELQTPQGEHIERVSYSAVRPALDALKPRWEALLVGRKGFFLEDKGWTLALHARFAEEQAAGEVLAAARRMADEAASSGPFRILSGRKFLEIGPTLAHKGRAVEYILQEYAWPGALPVYLGDDERDEEAFGAIKAQRGIAILVAETPRASQADCFLESPQAARQWLETLLASLK
jgi:trehalose-phosphatase